MSDSLSLVGERARQIQAATEKAKAAQAAAQQRQGRLPLRGGSGTRSVATPSIEAPVSSVAPLPPKFELIPKGSPNPSASPYPTGSVPGQQLPLLQPTPAASRTIEYSPSAPAKPGLSLAPDPGPKPPIPVTSAKPVPGVSVEPPNTVSAPSVSPSKGTVSSVSPKPSSLSLAPASAATPLPDTPPITPGPGAPGQNAAMAKMPLPDTPPVTPGPGSAPGEGARAAQAQRFANNSMSGTGVSIDSPGPKNNALSTTQVYREPPSVKASIGRGLNRLGTTGAIASTGAQLVDEFGAIKDVFTGKTSVGDWVKNNYLPSIMPGAAVGLGVNPFKSFEDGKKAGESAKAAGGGVSNALGSVVRSSVGGVVNDAYESGKALGTPIRGFVEGLTGSTPQPPSKPTDYSPEASDKRINDEVMKDRPAYQKSAFEEPKTQAQRFITQEKALQDNGYRYNTPDTGKPIAGNSAMYKDIADPTGNDNRTRAVVPGKGFAEIQRSKGFPQGEAGQRGGFAGSATDAEAARNREARMVQDEATDREVARINQQIEDIRNTSAERRGISRGQMDVQDGRMDTPQAREYLAKREAERAAQAPYEAMAKAQSAYADEIKAIDAARANAPKGFGMRHRSEKYHEGLDKRAAAAENMLNASLGINKERISAESDRQRAQAQALAAQAQEEGANRRAQEQNQTTLRAARMNQEGGLAREEVQQEGLSQRDRAKNMSDSFKAGADYLTKATSADGKNPPIVNVGKLTRFREGLNSKQLAALVGEETAARIKSGQLHPDEAQRLVGMAAQWDEDPASIWNLWMATAKTPSYTNTQPAE